MKRILSVFLAICLLLSLSSLSAYAKSDEYSAVLYNLDLGTAAPGYKKESYTFNLSLKNTGTIGFKRSSAYTKVELSGDDADKFMCGINSDNGVIGIANTDNTLIWIKPVNGLWLGSYKVMVKLYSSDVAGEYKLIDCAYVTFKVDDGWQFYEKVYSGDIECNDSLIKIVPDSKMFFSFSTHDKNYNHGYAPVVGFSCDFGEGSVVQEGFTVEEGHASDFGLEYVMRELHSDPYGFMISTGDLPVGTIGRVDYYLYKDDNFSWEEYNSPDYAETHERTEVKSLYFRVSDLLKDFEHFWDRGRIVSTTETTYTVKYFCYSCSAFYTETFNKKNSKLKARGLTVNLKYSKLRKKDLIIKHAISTRRAHGHRGIMSYKKLSGNRKIKVDRKTGRVTVKKGLKKGYYKVKVKVSISTSQKALAGSDNAIIKIRVN